MKAAFSTWENRIAPVFDVARQVRLVEAESGRILGETLETLESEVPLQKAHRLAELGVEALVCGAISRPLQAMVSSYGIRVLAFLAGDLREVIEAWLRNDLLKNDSFTMPGCCGRSTRGLPGARAPAKEEGSAMNGNSRKGQGPRCGSGRGAGMGQGGGRGLGRGQGGRGGALPGGGEGQGQGGAGQSPGAQRGGGLGRRGGPAAAGVGGSCVCPSCGHAEAHARGVPCNRQKCPKCGVAMTRQ